MKPMGPVIASCPAPSDEVKYGKKRKKEKIPRKGGGEKEEVLEAAAATLFEFLRPTEVKE